VLRGVKDRKMVDRPKLKAKRTEKERYKSEKL
jgi:hypothetical protein